MTGSNSLTTKLLCYNSQKRNNKLFIDPKEYFAPSKMLANKKRNRLSNLKDNTKVTTNPDDATITGMV